MEEEAGPDMYFPDLPKTTISMLSRLHTKILPGSQGLDCTGATNGELRWGYAPVNLKGAAPLRSGGLAFSRSNTLYILGGKPEEAADHPLVLKCEYAKWQPVQSFNDPVDETLGRFSGVVLHDSLYIIGCKEETAQAVIRRFNLRTCKWDSVPMPDCLSAGHTSLLAANNQELILFGRGYSEGFCHDDIISTFNPSSSTWQQHCVTGDKPRAQYARAMTVVENHVCVLVLKDQKLYIHELDLQTWHWWQLPQGRTSFGMTSKDTLTTTLVKGRWWVVHGGSVEVGGGYCNQIHAFDYETMCWSQSVVPPAQLGHLSGHMITCHNNKIIIVGGKRGKEMLADVVRVLGSFRQCEPASHEEPMPPFQLHNCQYGGAQQSRLLPDATITVGTEQFHVHRNVLADQSTYFHRLFSSCMKEGRSSQVVVAEFDPEVLGLAIDWMYGYLNEPLELRQAAHMMRAGDRFGIWGLRDASARICCQWLEHLRSESWLEHSQRVEVDHFMHFAKAIEDHDIAWLCDRVLTRSPIVCYGKWRTATALVRFSDHAFVAVGPGDRGRRVAGLEALLDNTASCTSHTSDAIRQGRGSADDETSNSQQTAAKTAPAKVSRSKSVNVPAPTKATIDIGARCGFDDGNKTIRAKTGKSLFGRAAGAMGGLGKNCLITGAVAGLGLLAAAARSASSSSSSRA